MSLTEILTSLTLDPGSSAKETNLRTRVLACALSKHGWPGEVKKRHRQSLISLGGGPQETCLSWKGEALNVAALPFSSKLMEGNQVYTNTCEAADEVLTRIIIRDHPDLYVEMCAAVEGFILRQQQNSINASPSAPRPRI